MNCRFEGRAPQGPVYDWDTDTLPMHSDPVEIGGATVEFFNRLTISRYPNGKTVEAAPHHTEEYRQRARDLGYISRDFQGNDHPDTDAMSRDHEVCHHLLADLVGLPASPVMLACALGHPLPPDHPPAGREEAAVLALQAWLRCIGIDPRDVARRRVGR
jgi:hypothetical protein